MSHVDAVRALARLSRVLERASGDLSLAHYRVLAAVADGDERASRVAERLALGKPTISASVDALCRRGLLTRRATAVDQRAVTLRLTPAGSAVLQDVEAAMTARLDAVLAHAPRGGDAAATLARLGVGLDRLADAQRAAGERAMSDACGANNAISPRRRSGSVGRPPERSERRASER